MQSQQPLLLLEPSITQLSVIYQTYEAQVSLRVFLLSNLTKQANKSLNYMFKEVEETDTSSTTGLSSQEHPNPPTSCQIT